MKVKLTPVEPIPENVTIEMSQQEAQTLLAIALTNIGVPRAVGSSRRGYPDEVVERFLGHVERGLKDVGVSL